MLVYFIVTLFFTDATPTASVKFLVTGGPKMCETLVTRFLSDPPQAVMEGHVVASYAVTCSVIRNSTPS